MLKKRIGELEVEDGAGRLQSRVVTGRYFLQMQCWGYLKIPMRSPNTREKTVNTFKYSDDARGDKESPKDCSSLKSCESFYTCPRAPFYRETKGLLHSENTPRT
jgi:hypothetical protein